MKAIELKNISKSFKQGGVTIHALKKTNFSAKAGEFIAVIGPSGSGKSTFLTIAGGLQTPDNGVVKIADNDFNKLNEKQRSDVRFREVGFILQSSNLIPFLTVLDQLKLHNLIKKEKFEIERAKELLKKLGIAKLKHKYPADLSGGEKQRVAIAKAIYHQPKLILADEPTASLDTKKATAVVEILAELANQMGTVIIMVTHDERMIDYCDSVYMMHDGVLKQRKDHKRSK